MWFGKPQNWKASQYLSNFKFQEVFEMKLEPKSTWFETKIVLLKGFVMKKTRRGQNAPSCIY